MKDTPDPYRMCLDCLKLKLESIEEYDTRMRGFLESKTCECCKSYPNFLKEVNEDLKVLCLTKMKKYGENVCPHHLEKVKEFEGMVKRRISFRLNAVMEQLDDAKDELQEGHYLTKCGDLKDLNDFVAQLDTADNNNAHEDYEEEEWDGTLDNDFFEEVFGWTNGEPLVAPVFEDNTQ